MIFSLFVLYVYVLFVEEAEEKKPASKPPKFLLVSVIVVGLQTRGFYNKMAWLLGTHIYVVALLSTIKSTLPLRA